MMAAGDEMGGDNGSDLVGDRPRLGDETLGLRTSEDKPNGGALRRWRREPNGGESS